MPGEAPIPADMAALGQTPEAIVRHVDGQCRRIETPCGDGTMAWRVWGPDAPGGEPLILLHGGYGSWTHWIRNVIPLSARYRVIAPDMPGLGESATPAEPYTAESLTEIMMVGLAGLLGPEEMIDVVGFSFGGVLSGHVAKQLGGRLRSVTIVGSGGLGARRSDLAPLKAWRKAPTPEEQRALHRENLAILMFADAGRIDPLAVHLQERNAAAARIKSPPISRTDTLRRALLEVQGEIRGIWGDQDNVAGPYIDERRAVLEQIRPGLDMRLLPGAGHWAAYEQAAAFNAMLLDMLTRPALRTPAMSQGNR